ncbi:TIGR03621 family F420-dependent LLM class oxidoreductase [Nocardia sp. XZ_19_385]|uniref:TIGR03621 family F420-dependent LLM class oxidoreductase n=1 Tax=Nocardia sp. XZ_19_385 TaxID=2769488 RepID=UPI00188E4CA6|nr:TIGR03621 family F420-dependent LLM class oxidoreductase [Nocardia sp. XZ_19_385]
MAAAVTFSIQGNLAGVESWTEFAQACERDGFDTLLLPDHPGACAAPFVSLAAAAAVTQRIRLGTNVINGGLWDPLPLAVEVATLDLLSAGRVDLGVGAGHNPFEWSMQGAERPSASARIARMIELTDLTRRLLAGETVSAEGEHFTVREALLTSPRPVQQRMPLRVGGNNPRLLRYAAATADIIDFTGLGRTLADGRDHETRWGVAQIDAQVDLVRRAADAAGRAPEFEVLVQHLEITDDAEAAADALAAEVTGATGQDLLNAPYVLIGTLDELRSEVLEHQKRWGFGRFIVRGASREAAARLLAALRG